MARHGSHSRQVRSPHDSLQAAYNESLPRILSAARQALQDYQTLYPNNDPANLLAQDFDNMTRSLWDHIEVDVLKYWREEFWNSVWDSGEEK
jgi:hypothetical protein